MCYHRRALPPPAGTSMKAEIISIGTELLLGEIVDLNSPYLAGELPKLGIDVYHIQSIGDNMDRLLDSLRRSMERSDLVLMTGGLGPTDDDLTRAAVARLLGEELYVDPELEAQVRGFFGNRGITMPENNIKQAMLIPSPPPSPTRWAPLPAGGHRRTARYSSRCPARRANCAICGRTRYAPACATWWAAACSPRAP